MAIIALGCFSYYTLSSQASNNASEKVRDSKIDKILQIANDSDGEQQINVFVIAKNTSAVINDSVDRVSPHESAPFLVNLTQ